MTGITSEINFPKIDAEVTNLYVQLFPFFLIMEGKTKLWQLHKITW